MLSHKPWKLEGVLRLGLSLLVCVCAGSLLASILYFHGKPADKVRFGLLACTAFGLMGLTLGMLQKSWEGEKSIKLAASTLCSFYIGLIIAVFAGGLAGSTPTGTHTLTMAIGMVSMQGSALFLTQLFLKRESLTWNSAFGFKIAPGRALLWGLAAGAIFLPVATFLHLSLGYLVEHLPHQSFKVQEQIAVQTIRSATTWQNRAVLGFFTIILAPIAEEVMFRGILYPTLKKIVSTNFAMLIASILFAAVHISLSGSNPGAGAVHQVGISTSSLLMPLIQSFPLLVPLFCLAMLLTFLYEKTENLASPISTHALFNGANFIILCFTQGT